MQKIFPSLYRADFGPRGADKQMSHSYLLVRKQGNLLICHCNRGSNILDHLDEIEALGGIDTQFVPHFHDAKRGDLHQQLYDRFGCEICYHEGERQSMRTKTKCPEREFGNEGLQLGSDFEAHFFPGHTPGMSVFTWKHRGKRFLFPSHVIGLEDKAWRTSFAPHLAPDQKSRFGELAKMDIDVWVRGGSAEGRQAYHVLTSMEKKALKRVLREKINPKASKSSKPRIVTGFLPMLQVLRESKRFDVQEVPAYNTCKPEMIESHMGAADVVFFQNTPRTFPEGHLLLNRLREFVEKGGGALIADSRPKTKKNWIINTHPFPEIAEVAFPATMPKKEGQDLIVESAHPALGKLKKGATFPTNAQVGMTFVPGTDGTILLRNSFDEPIGVAGQVGKGRVVVLSYHHGVKTTIGDAEQKVLPDIAAWLAG